MAAKVSFVRTTNAKLKNVPKKEGQLIYVTDTGAQYFDTSTTNRIQIKDPNAINKNTNSDVSAILNFTNGIKINGTKISYDATTDTVTFE